MVDRIVSVSSGSMECYDLKVNFGSTAFFKKEGFSYFGDFKLTSSFLCIGSGVGESIRGSIKLYSPKSDINYFLPWPRNPFASCKARYLNSGIAA